MNHEEILNEEELIAFGVLRIKKMIDMREPPFDFPADSIIADAVHDILLEHIKRLMRYAQVIADKLPPKNLNG